MVLFVSLSFVSSSHVEQVLQSNVQGLFTIRMWLFTSRLFIIIFISGSDNSKLKQRFSNEIVRLLSMYSFIL